MAQRVSTIALMEGPRKIRKKEYVFGILRLPSSYVLIYSDGSSYLSKASRIMEWWVERNLSGFFFNIFANYLMTAIHAELKKKSSNKLYGKNIKKRKTFSLIIGNVALSALSITRVDYKYLQPTITNTANVQKKPFNILSILSVFFF